MVSISRRAVLKMGLAVGGVSLFPILQQQAARGSDQISAQLPPVYKLPFKCPPLAVPRYQGVSTAGTPYQSTGTFNGSLEPINFTSRDVYQIDIKRASVDILGNGQKTQVWAYNGITPGPTIRVKKGVEALVRFRNVIDRPDNFGNPVWTSVHLHGMYGLAPAL